MTGCNQESLPQPAPTCMPPPVRKPLNLDLETLDAWHEARLEEMPTEAAAHAGICLSLSPSLSWLHMTRQQLLALGTSHHLGWLAAHHPGWLVAHHVGLRLLFCLSPRAKRPGSSICRIIDMLCLTLLCASPAGAAQWSMRLSHCWGGRPKLILYPLRLSPPRAAARKASR